MPHRQIAIGERVVHSFDTSLAAKRYIDRSSGDCIVLARNSFYFQRKEDAEITVRLNATDNPENRHLVSAATRISDEVEAMIERTHT